MKEYFAWSVFSILFPFSIVLWHLFQVNVLRKLFIFGYKVLKGEGNLQQEEFFTRYANNLFF